MYTCQDGKYVAEIRPPPVLPPNLYTAKLQVQYNRTLASQLQTRKELYGKYLPVLTPKEAAILGVDVRSP